MTSTFLFYNRLALLILFITILSKNAHSQKRITLKEAINIGLENNPEVRQALLNQASNNLDLTQSKLDLYPNLNGTSTSNLNFVLTTEPSTNLVLPQTSYTFTSQLMTNVLIFQGFQKLEQIKHNKSLLESCKSNAQRLKNNLKLEIISTFFTFLSYQDQLTAVNEQFDLANQSLENDVKAFKAKKKM